MRHTLLPSTLICDFRNTHISPRFLQRIDFQKTDFGAEFGAEPGFVDSTVQLVDLFEGEAFGFVDEEPDECDADEAETGCFFNFLGVSFWYTQMGLVWGWGFFGGAAYLPQMKKTLDWRFACSSLTMYGVEYAWTREIRCFVLFFSFLSRMVKLTEVSTYNCKVE